LDGDAFCAHEFHDVLINFTVELMQHVAAHIVPVVTATMAGGETSGAVSFVKDSDGDTGAAEDASSIETAGTTAEDSDASF
jgi:hypothetical protein